MSSSGSLDLLRRVRLDAPRFAADMWDRRGELQGVSDKLGGVERWEKLRQALAQIKCRGVVGKDKPH